MILIWGDEVDDYSICSDMRNGRGRICMRRERSHDERDDVARGKESIELIDV